MPPLTLQQILSWADAHRARTGQWPSYRSGPINEAPNLKWLSVQRALVKGERGLPKGWTIARLLARERGVRSTMQPPRLSPRQIVRWCDRHRERTGFWPHRDSGSVVDAPDETWCAVDDALKRGSRGLPRGSSLALLLAMKRGRHHVFRQAPLSVGAVLEWADAHCARTGDWPQQRSGAVHGADGEQWAWIDDALRHGRRGLPGDLSLAKLLLIYRHRSYHGPGKPLTIREIVAWAREHHRRAGQWPTKRSGPILCAPGETWQRIDSALKDGRRGLVGRSTLLLVLQEHCNVPHRKCPPALTEQRILKWARDHKRATGQWPTLRAGSVAGLSKEHWVRVDPALRRHTRGVHTIGSPPKLLSALPGYPFRGAGMPLTTERILAWADDHHRHTGRWPRVDSGAVRCAANEHWGRLDDALRNGRRGMPPGGSLPRLLAQHRDYPFARRDRPRLDPDQVLAWADDHHRRTGEWPTGRSGIVHASPADTWHAINHAMSNGYRGYTGPRTLAKLLAEHRGRRFQGQGGPLTDFMIVQWLKSHHARTGQWPRWRCVDPIPEAPGESWAKINWALIKGIRGLRGGGSITKLLVAHCGYRHPRILPRLTLKQILAWADGYHQRTGDWPSRGSGPISEFPGESWAAVDRAMKQGTRGLRRGWTIVRLLATHRRLPYSRKGLPLSPELILQWAREHRELTGRLPTMAAGAVQGVPGEAWAAIDASLRSGKRHLRGGRSLDEFLYSHYVDAYADIGRPLTRDLIVEWMRRFRQRVGRWPTAKSAFIDSSRTERWSAVDYALRRGTRGLPGGSSLAKLRKQVQAR